MGGGPQRATNRTTGPVGALSGGGDDRCAFGGAEEKKRAPINVHFALLWPLLRPPSDETPRGLGRGAGARGGRRKQAWREKHASYETCLNHPVPFLWPGDNTKGHRSNIAQRSTKFPTCFLLNASSVVSVFARFELSVFIVPGRGGCRAGQD